jgi:adenylyl-sulfate kinase
MISANVTWQPAAIDRTHRWRALRQQGATVWFTGLPGSGKSSVAAAVEQQLVDLGRCAYRLDGDNMRHGICGDLGFSPDDREQNVRRVGEVARLFADSGTVALVSLVSPYAACRDRVRELHERDGLLFLEVFVNTPAEECARRDPKGLYRSARRGRITDLTGVGAPYEPPLNPDIELTTSMRVADSAQLVLATLQGRQADTPADSSDWALEKPRRSGAFR